MDRLTRRRALRVLGGTAVGVAGTAASIACGDTQIVSKEVPVETTVIKEVPVERIVTKTVIKEVPIEKIVEKIVTKEVVVEKIVETERIVFAQPKLSGENIEVVPGFVPASLQSNPLFDGRGLPKVADRLPQEPLVYRPLRRIGKYGGTWRRGFTGPADGQNFDRVVHDHMLYWDTQVTKIVPHLARGWDISDGGRVFKIFLREGHRWSDSAPFTADDVLFWYDDLYLNEELSPGPMGWNAISDPATGEATQGVWAKVDDTTFQVTHAAPYFSFLEELASFTAQGHFTHGSSAMGTWGPKHYSSRFHPGFVGEETANTLATEAGYENWNQHFRFVNNPKLDLNCPTTAPWKPQTPLNTAQFILEANPFYHAVDIEGNQLPYINLIQGDLADNLEVLNLRAVAGEYDMQARHVDISKLPVLKENELRSNYTVSFWRGLHGSDATFFINANYGDGVAPELDPSSHDLVLAELLRDVNFRRSLSLGIARFELNEIFWVGIGNPGSTSPATDSPFSPGAADRDLWATLDLDAANTLLDDLGLAKGDDGLRQRPDGQGPIVLEVLTTGAAFVNWTGIAEAVAEMWQRNLGIKTNVRELERNLFVQRRDTNDYMISVWSNDGNDNPWTYIHHAMMGSGGSQMGGQFGKWLDSGGKSGIDPATSNHPDGALIAQTQSWHAQGKGVPVEERIALGRQILHTVADRVWAIGTVGNAPTIIGVRVRSNNLENVAETMPFSTPAQTPGHGRPTQWFFKNI